MTAGVQTLYPKPLKSNGLVESYKDYCPTHIIPEKTINNEINSMIKLIESKPGFNKNLKFDPLKHIIFNDEYYKSTKTFTLDDLEIEKTHIKPLNNFGATFPFKLLSEEAIDMLIWEALTTIDTNGRLPNLATNATRLDFHIGCNFKKSKFTNDLAKSEILSNIVSNFVGYKLKPVWESDLVHINCSLATNDPIELNKFPKDQNEIEKILKLQDACDGQDIPSTLGVHYDSISIPLVIMLDLPNEAQGGQTTILTGKNTVTRVPDPPRGSGTLIQGRVLRHLASKPVTNHNRISFVISYATGVDGELDNCVTTSLKPSVLPKNEFNKFYKDWTEYKFLKLESHLKKIREQIVDDYEQGKGFDQELFVEKCLKIEKYFHGIYEEMECVENKPYPPPYFNTPYNEL
ncbi:hypothetical protein C6P40_002774 [Pichia californica]|uniref:Fe2OG dioxygenase domain-containing protein n=1 Tax=Pichia californica TaxID=460514 RepID=A0A9P7BCP3_9ASCO|nr:hypothetical protein C6P40_002774 [[Candida] californica]